MTGEPRAAQLLLLQRTAGNRAVTRLVQTRSGRHPNRPDGGPVWLQREWDLSNYQDTEKDGYERLLAELGAVPKNANSRKRARGRLAEWAKVTDSPVQVRRLLQLADRENLTTLLKQGSGAQIEKLLGIVEDGPSLVALLTKVGGAGQLAQFYQEVTTDAKELDQLLGLETNLDVLKALKAEVTNVGWVVGLLNTIPGPRRGASLQETLALAGGWAQFRLLAPLTRDVPALRKLIDWAGNFAAVRAVASWPELAGKGKGLPGLEPFGPFDTVVNQIRATPGAESSQVKLLVSQTRLAAKAPGAMVHPKSIRFTQETVTNKGEGYTVRGNIAKLESEPAWEIPTSVRVFIKEEWMNDQIPDQRTDFGPASPRNLKDGQVYALDNRRLYAYQEAGRTAMPAPTFAAFGVVRRESYKFSTTNQGLTAALS